MLIIDSLSHAWAGPGGILDMHDRVTKSTRNPFVSWREVTPAHNALVDAMLGANCHLIATLRTKTSYEVVNDGGKTKVTKVGLAPQQRDGLEYEFTVVFDPSIEDHVATATKDRSGLFDGRFFTPVENTGISLGKWLESGVDVQEGGPEPDGGVAGQSGERPHDFLLDRLDDMLNQLGLGGYADAYHDYVCERYKVGSLEALEGKQLAEQLKLLWQCKMKEEKLKQLLEILEQHKIAA